MKTQGIAARGTRAAHLTGVSALLLAACFQTDADPGVVYPGFGGAGGRSGAAGQDAIAGGGAAGSGASESGGSNAQGGAGSSGTGGAATNHPSADASTDGGGAEAAVPSPDVVETADAADASIDASEPGVDAQVAPEAAVNTTPDTDIALVRLNPDGTLDMTYGTGGISIIDVQPGYVGTGTGNIRDALTSIARDAQNRVYLFGGSKGGGVRLDLDRVVVRVAADGTEDTTFGTAGVYAFNLANQAEQAGSGFIAPDGKVVSTGYAAWPTGVGTQTANRLTQIRLYDYGALDPTFGAGGVVNQAPFIPADLATTQWGMAETYAIARQSTDSYIAVGDGRAASTGRVDAIAIRYTSVGAVDTTWASNGLFTFGLSVNNDRARNLVVLPNDRVCLVGSATPRTGVINGLIAMLTPGGALDTTFDTDGYKLYDFGSPSAEFYGAAVSPSGTFVAAAGYRFGGGIDEDAILVLLPTADGATDIAQTVALSETQNDRYWSVAFDDSDRVYAAGFARSETSTDTSMVVARYLTSGSLDTTFGTGGKVTINVAEGGTNLETARGVVVQTDGKIVIAGPVERL